MRLSARHTKRMLSAAVSCYNQGDPSRARELCEQILAKTPNDGQARHLLALACMTIGDLRTSLDNLELLIAAEPERLDVHQSIARALSLAGRTSEAEAHLSRAVEIAPTAVDSHLSLAKLCLDTNRHEDAEAHLRRALAVAPNHPQAIVNLGGHLAQHGDAEEGVRLLTGFLEKDRSVPAAHYNLGNAYKRLGRFEAALPCYRKAVELQPNFHGAWHNLGNLLIELGQPREAFQAYDRAFRIKRRPGGPERPSDQFRTTNRCKLRHDIEQFRYLLDHGHPSGTMTEAIPAYEALLRRLPEPKEGAYTVDIPEEDRPRLAPSYNRLTYLYDAEALTGAAVNPELDFADIEADYLKNVPGHTVVDSLLTPDALRDLRRFCLESTVWYEFRYANGYIGAFMGDGFACPLLLQIAEELQQGFPTIFRRHTLRKLWAFKYDSRLAGIPIHADFAAINVNFWITPDEANLDPDGGGLVFYDKQAPPDWDFETYNTNESAMRAFLRDSDARAINVPHRQNRAVIFNSDLFHETGKVTFREGYENRRINITMLFGRRADG